MSKDTLLMSGLILISIPTIEFGGYFLLSVLQGKHPELKLNKLQKAFFRAGHAHAGVIVILSLVCEVFADYMKMDDFWIWFVRIGIPFSSLLISGGFFVSVIGKDVTKPNKLIYLLYSGAILLSVSLVVLGIGLLKAV